MTTMPSNLIDFAPLAAEEAVQRLLAQRWAGLYDLSGGAVWWAPTAIDELGNEHAGTVDCSGLIAWAYKYRRRQWNCNEILGDARGPQRRWMLVHRGERVRPGDVIVHAGPDLDHDGVPDANGHGHIGGIATVDERFEHLLTDYELLGVVHSSGALQLHVDPTDPLHRKYGTTRLTNAAPWHLNGYVVRARHVVYAAA